MRKSQNDETLTPPTEDRQIFVETRQINYPVTTNGVFSSFITLRRLASAAIIITFIIIIFFADKVSFKNLLVYHPILMTVCFVGILPELIYSIAMIRCGARYGVSRQTLLKTHKRYSLAFKLFSTFGIIMIEWSKFSRSKRHFKSWHACIGIVSEISQVLEVIIGITLFFSIFENYIIGSYRVILCTIHRFFALVALTTGLIAMSLGMFSHFAERTISSDIVRLIFAILPFVIVIWGYYARPQQYQ